MTNNYADAERLEGGFAADGRARTPDFALALERDGSGAAVLVLSGELDLYRAPEIMEGLAELIGRESIGSVPDVGTSDGSSDGARSVGDGRRVAVDLRQVSFIDSTTLALLLDASRREQARNGELLVLVGPQTPMTAFEVTGFDRLLALRLVDEDGSDGAA
jgi:anti-anti-sigma regulatory factor